MKTKIFNISLKIILSLLLVFPVLGILGFFPAPTRDMYNSDQAFAFIQIATSAHFINYAMAAVNIIALLALWTKREALATLLILPITVNIIGFHLFLDGGLFNGGAVMADVLLILNVYFLWKKRSAYKELL